MSRLELVSSTRKQSQLRIFAIVVHRAHVDPRGLRFKMANSTHRRCDVLSPSQNRRQPSAQKADSNNPYFFSPSPHSGTTSCHGGPASRSWSRTISFVPTFAFKFLVFLGCWIVGRPLTTWRRH